MANGIGKKILFLSNVLSHIRAFHIPYMKWFHDNGFTVHVLTNSGGGEIPHYCDKLHDVAIKRSPFHIGNISALKKAKRIINEEKYDIVHCHTPMGGVVGRLASRKARKNGTIVIYTAHGFHFYTGAPAMNWMFYFSVEKILSRITDCIITINNEDYYRAQKLFRTRIELISGIGVDANKFFPRNMAKREELRRKYGWDGKFNLIYAAEFIPRKNHKFFINCLVDLKNLIPNVKFIFAGKGPLLDKMKAYAGRCGVLDRVAFLGFRKDICDLYAAADVVVSASFQEGFALNIIEGMLSGLPAVASIIRGHKESITDGENGFLFDTHCFDDFNSKIMTIYKSTGLYEKLSCGAVQSAKEYTIDHSLEQMICIYNSFTKTMKKGTEIQKNKPLVSVVMPVYNGSNYMREAIDSVLAQTYENIEIVLVNDGSNDGGMTDEIAQSYGDKIKYIDRKENKGIAYTLNEGIANMSGEYFAWLSHDDLYVPNKIQRHVEFLQNIAQQNTDIDKTKLIACGPLDIIDAAGNMIRRKKSQKPTKLVRNTKELLLNNLNNYGLSGCTVLIHKNAFAEVGGFDASWITLQDANLWYRLILRGYTFCYCSDRLVKNRSHNEETGRRLKDIYDLERSKFQVWLTEQIYNRPELRDGSMFLKIGCYQLKMLHKEAATKSFHYAKQLNRSRLLCFQYITLKVYYTVFGYCREVLKKLYWTYILWIAKRKRS